MITKEAIEAASATYWQNHWKIFSENAKRPIRETMEKALEAALPFLPIAVEGRWLPITHADRTITDVQDFSEVGITLRNSDRYWVRDPDGRVYEASWTDDKDGYWWDWEAESPVDPIEFMPHPLDPRFSASPSSPGKDGGQEPVGTGVFENGKMIGFIGLGDEFNPDAERPRDTRPIFTTPHPDGGHEAEDVAWEAHDEATDGDNFATSIYEAAYDGLLVARCNQNGNHPWQAAAIIRGLSLNKRLPLQKLPAAFEVLDTENGTYLTRSEIAAQNSGFEYNGLYRRDSAEARSAISSPQPASTALVERVANTLKAIREDILDYWLPDTAKGDAIKANMVLRIDAALSSSHSTIREGER